MMVINPANRETASSILMKYGMSDLQEETKIATEQAIREFSRFMEDPMYQPEIHPLTEDSESHLLQHRKDGNSQEFEELRATNPQRAAEWDAHIQLTMLNISAAQVALGGLVPPEVLRQRQDSQKGQGTLPGSLPGSSGEGTGGETAPVRKGREAAAHRDQGDTSGGEPIP